MRKTTIKEKNKTKQEIGQNFWLTFYSSSLMKINLYMSQTKWTDPRIGSRWLAGKPFGWRSERNRCGEPFLTPTVTPGTFVLKKKNTKHFYCYFLFLILLKPTMNIFKKVDIHPQKSERTLNNDIALQKVFVHAPFLPFPSCTPFICGFS